MNSPIDPGLDHDPRIPAIWTREQIIEALHEARRDYAEERTENRKLKREIARLEKLVDDLENRILHGEEEE